MSIVTLIVILLIVGFVVYLIQTLPIPINNWFKMAISGIILIAALIWVLNSLGFSTGMHLRIR